MKGGFVFTSESVTEGHPDKLCDQISDAIVDAYLAEDPFAAINAECVAAKGILFIAVRFASRARVDVTTVARQVIEQVGYVEDSGFDAQSCSILTSFNEMPSLRSQRDERDMDGAEIAAVTAAQQVNVFGYACDQTDVLMPAPIRHAHRLARHLDEVRKSGTLDYLAPDGQSQVAIEFRDGEPARIQAVTLTAATYGNAPTGAAQIEADLKKHVLEPCFESAAAKPDNRTSVNVNPAGRVPIGGPTLHAGLTGRKNGIDTYGEYSRHSGAALSGKDPNRIDRIGAYAARYAAKNIVAAGLARECEVTLSYAIGLATPVAIGVRTHGTGKETDAELTTRLIEVMDFRPAAIVGRFRLRHLPQLNGGSFYRHLAAYGHVGRDDLPVPWEQTDLGEKLV
jgi:S-adenosylmethionine synthetase